MSVKFQPEVKQNFSTRESLLAKLKKKIKRFTEAKIGSGSVECLYFDHELKETEKKKKKKLCLTSDNQGIHRSIILPCFRSGAEKCTLVS